MFAAVAPACRYEFNDQAAPVQPTDRTLGAYHGAELLYLFTVPQSQAPMTAAQKQLSNQTMHYLVPWPQYDAAARQLLSLD
jgi:carboxylesterase type B